MTLAEIKSFAQAMAPVVREAVSEATAPLNARIADLEKQLADRPIPRDGVDGKDGVDGLDGVVGRDGIDGKDADPELIRSMVEEAVAALPTPKDGIDGINGKDAEPVTQDQIAAAVQCALEPREGVSDPVAVQVQRWMETNPVKHGVDGLPGKDGRDGTDGENGADGLNGKDGQTAPVVASAFKDHAGELVLTLTDGSVLKTGIMDGAPGKDGRDGMTLTDFDTEMKDGGRTLVLSLESDEVKVTHELPINQMLYRGVYKAGDAYDVGDTVTWGGNLYHCNAPTTEKPGEGSTAWTMAVRRGRDGKDGKDGDRGPEGKSGPPGRDGRSFS